jgi:hypothetical protein
VAQLCVAALDKGWAIAGEPRLDLSHACSPECINIYGLVSKLIFKETLINAPLALSECETENAISCFLHFQSLVAIENGATFL